MFPVIGRDSTSNSACSPDESLGESLKRISDSELRSPHCPQPGFLASSSFLLSSFSASFFLYRYSSAWRRSLVSRVYEEHWLGWYYSRSSTHAVPPEDLSIRTLKGIKPCSIRSLCFAILALKILQRQTKDQIRWFLFRGDTLGVQRSPNPAFLLLLCLPLLLCKP